MTYKKPLFTPINRGGLINLEKINKISLFSELNIIYSFLNEFTLNFRQANQKTTQTCRGFLKKRGSTFFTRPQGPTPFNKGGVKTTTNKFLLKDFNPGGLRQYLKAHLNKGGPPLGLKKGGQVFVNIEVFKYWLFYLLNKKNKKLKLFSSIEKKMHPPYFKGGQKNKGSIIINPPAVPLTPGGFPWGLGVVPGNTPTRFNKGSALKGIGEGLISLGGGGNNNPFLENKKKKISHFSSNKFTKGGKEILNGVTLRGANSLPPLLGGYLRRSVSLGLWAKPIQKLTQTNKDHPGYYRRNFQKGYIGVNKFIFKERLSVDKNLIFRKYHPYGLCPDRVTQLKSDLLIKNLFYRHWLVLFLKPSLNYNWLWDKVVHQKNCNEILLTKNYKSKYIKTNNLTYRNYNNKKSIEKIYFNDFFLLLNIKKILISIYLEPKFILHFKIGQFVNQKKIQNLSQVSINNPFKNNRDIFSFFTQSFMIAKKDEFGHLKQIYCSRDFFIFFSALKGAEPVQSSFDVLIKKYLRSTYITSQRQRNLSLTPHIFKEVCFQPLSIKAMPPLLRALAPNPFIMEGNPSFIKGGLKINMSHCYFPRIFTILEHSKYTKQNYFFYKGSIAQIIPINIFNSYLAPSPYLPFMGIAHKIGGLQSQKILKRYNYHLDNNRISRFLKGAQPSLEGEPFSTLITTISKPFLNGKDILKGAFLKIKGGTSPPASLDRALPLRALGSVHTRLNDFYKYENFFLKFLNIFAQLSFLKQSKNYFLLQILILKSTNFLPIKNYLLSKLSFNLINQTKFRYLLLPSVNQHTGCISGPLKYHPLIKVRLWEKPVTEVLPKPTQTGARLSGRTGGRFSGAKLFINSLLVPPNKKGANALNKGGIALIERAEPFVLTPYQPPLRGYAPRAMPILPPPLIRRALKGSALTKVGLRGGYKGALAPFLLGGGIKGFRGGWYGVKDNALCPYKESFEFIKKEFIKNTLYFKAGSIFSRLKRNKGIGEVTEGSLTLPYSYKAEINPIPPPPLIRKALKGSALTPFRGYPKWVTKVGLRGGYKGVKGQSPYRSFLKTKKQFFDEFDFNIIFKKNFNYLNFLNKNLILLNFSNQRFVKLKKKMLLRQLYPSKAGVILWALLTPYYPPLIRKALKGSALRGLRWVGNSLGLIRQPPLIKKFLKQIPSNSLLAPLKVDSLNKKSLIYLTCGPWESPQDSFIKPFRVTLKGLGPPHKRVSKHPFKDFNRVVLWALPGTINKKNSQMPLREEPIRVFKVSLRGSFLKSSILRRAPLRPLTPEGVPTGIRAEPLRVFRYYIRAGFFPPENKIRALATPYHSPPQPFRVTLKGLGLCPKGYALWGIGPFLIRALKGSALRGLRCDIKGFKAHKFESKNLYYLSAYSDPPFLNRAFLNREKLWQFQLNFSVVLNLLIQIKYSNYNCNMFTSNFVFINYCKKIPKLSIFNFPIKATPTLYFKVGSIFSRLKKTLTGSIFLLTGFAHSKGFALGFNPLLPPPNKKGANALNKGGIALIERAEPFVPVGTPIPPPPLKRKALKGSALTPFIKEGLPFLYKEVTKVGLRGGYKGVVFTPPGVRGGWYGVGKGIGGGANKLLLLDEITLITLRKSSEFHTNYQFYLKKLKIKGGLYKLLLISNKRKEWAEPIGYKTNRTYNWLTKIGFLLGGANSLPPLEQLVCRTFISTQGVINPRLLPPPPNKKGGGYTGVKIVMNLITISARKTSKLLKVILVRKLEFYNQLVNFIKSRICIPPPPMPLSMPVRALIREPKEPAFKYRVLKDPNLKGRLLAPLNSKYECAPFYNINLQYNSKGGRLLAPLRKNQLITEATPKNNPKGYSWGGANKFEKKITPLLIGHLPLIKHPLLKLGLEKIRGLRFMDSMKLLGGSSTPLWFPYGTTRPLKGGHTLPCILRWTLPGSFPAEKKPLRALPLRALVRALKSDLDKIRKKSYRLPINGPQRGVGKAHTIYFIDNCYRFLLKKKKTNFHYFKRLNFFNYFLQYHRILKLSLIALSWLPQLSRKFKKKKNIINTLNSFLMINLKFKLFLKLILRLRGAKPPLNCVSCPYQAHNPYLKGTPPNALTNPHNKGKALTMGKLAHKKKDRALSKEAGVKIRVAPYKVNSFSYKVERSSNFKKVPPPINEGVKLRGYKRAKNNKIRFQISIQNTVCLFNLMQPPGLTILTLSKVQLYFGSNISIFKKTNNLFFCLSVLKFYNISSFNENLSNKSAFHSLKTNYGQSPYNELNSIISTPRAFSIIGEVNGIPSKGGRLLAPLSVYFSEYFWNYLFEKSKLSLILKQFKKFFIKTGLFNNLLNNLFKKILQIQAIKIQYTVNSYYGSFSYGENLLFFFKKLSYFYKYKNNFLNVLKISSLRIKEKKLFHTEQNYNFRNDLSNIKFNSSKDSRFFFYGFYIFQKIKVNPRANSLPLLWAKPISFKKKKIYSIHNLKGWPENELNSIKFFYFSKNQLIKNKINTPPNALKGGGVQQIKINPRALPIVRAKPISFETVILPVQENLKNHMNQIKDIFFKVQGESQESLIKKISPIIYKWSDYYKIIAKSPNKFQFLLIKILWKWCSKRHNHVSNFWIKEKYFFSLNNKKYLFCFLLGKKVANLKTDLYSIYNPNLTQTLNSKGTALTMGKAHKMEERVLLLNSKLRSNKLNKRPNINLKSRVFLWALPINKKSKSLKKKHNLIKNQLSYNNIKINSLSYGPHKILNSDIKRILAIKSVFIVLAKYY